MGTRRFTALIVDSDRDSVDIIGMVLNGMGHRFRCVKSVQDAKSAVENGEVDLAIIDLALAGREGVEFCKWIKQEKALEFLPILVLTTLEEDKHLVERIRDRLEALENGADEYLTKPFLMHDLKGRLSVLLRIRGLYLDLMDAQSRIIKAEKAQVAEQLGGAACHKIGQPLTSMKLNLHLIATLDPSDSKYKEALEALRRDINAIASIVEKMKSADPERQEPYPGGKKILDF
ncbi:MAG: response regulator [Candidatus Dadabacteria bacterium]|nr:MAG: response regulator [Candidatus Dadabacteria bacterium]